MTNFNSSDLSDPQPPVPGERERSLVTARAHQLGRRRRLLQGAGALGVVAAVSVSVAALTAGGSSGPGANRVEVANAATDTTHAVVAPSTTTPTTVPPTVATTAPAPASDTTPAPANDAPAATADTPPVTAAAPSTFTLSGTVTGNPADTTVTITLQGAGGTFTATADSAGNFSISGLPAGDYQAVGQWVDSTGTATRAQRFGTVTITGDSTVSFSFT